MLRKTGLIRNISLIVGILGIGFTWGQFGDNSLVSGYEVPGITQGTPSNNDDRLLDVIQATVNWILGMLSAIALILCIRGGFQMLTAAGDDSKVKTGAKVLKNAAIGLAIIGLSWLIVSFIFRIVAQVTN